MAPKSMAEYKASLITVKARKREGESLAQGIFKNIQPISVGV